MNKYKKINLGSYIKSIKDEILTDNIEIVFDTDNDSDIDDTDWLIKDILSGEYKRRMKEQEKKQEKKVDANVNLITFPKTKTLKDDDDDDDIDIDAELDTSWLEELTFFPKDEKKKFERYLDKSGLKPTTIKNHLRNLDKYEKFATGKKNQDGFYKSIMNSNVSTSQKLTIASTLSKYLQFMESPNDKIVSLIIEINNNLKTGYLERNISTTYEYNKQDIEKEMDTYFQNKMYKHFIITYLVYNYNVRNTDLNLILCKDKPETQEGYNYLYYNDIEYKELLKDLAATNVERLKLPLLRDKYYEVKREYEKYKFVMKPNQDMLNRRAQLLDDIIRLEKSNNKERLRNLRLREKKLYPPSDDEEYEIFEDKLDELKIEFENLKSDYDTLRKEIEEKEDEEEDEQEDEEEKKEEEEFVKYADHYFTPIYFIRNNYKTSKTYGKKVYKIWDERFHIAFHTYRDWLLNITEKEPEITDVSYKNAFVEQQEENFNKLQLYKREALKTEDYDIDKDYFLMKQYIRKGEIKLDDFSEQRELEALEEYRFTGFMDTFKDILRYEKKINIKQNARVPYIKYRKNVLRFIGNPDYWQNQFELIKIYMKTAKYSNWETESERRSVAELEKLIHNKEVEIVRYKRQTKYISKYNVDLLVPSKTPRISYENGLLVFYGNSIYWNKEVDKVEKRLNTLNKHLRELKQELKETMSRPQEIYIGQEIEIDDELRRFKKQKQKELDEIEEMGGGGRGGRKKSLKRILAEEEKELFRLYPNILIREQKRKEYALARKKKEEQEAKEAQEKEEAKQKRKEEVAEQRRQRLAVIRERRSKQARERKEKEAKEKQERKFRREARKEIELELGADKRKTRKHDKPAGVIIYPDSFEIKQKRKFSEGISFKYEDLNRYYGDETTKQPVINDCVYLFPQPIHNSTNTVKKYLPFKLKTSDILKIILKENNSLSEASRIGSRRGTSLETLQNSYNLNG